MLLFPFAIIRSSLFFSRRRAQYLLSLHSLYLRWISFFLLSSFRARSPSRASPYPSFLLARLTKMGPAASGSRFPRKLSSYKINYPPYFIAPRRSGPGCASTWARGLLPFSPASCSRGAGRVSDELDSLKDRNEDIGAIVVSSRSSGNDSPEKWRKIEKAERDPLSQITNEKTRDKNGDSFRTVMLLISALERKYWLYLTWIGNKFFWNIRCVK